MSKRSPDEPVVTARRGFLFGGLRYEAGEEIPRSALGDGRKIQQMIRGRLVWDGPAPARSVQRQRDAAAAIRDVFPDEPDPKE